mmetsp:Transcript_18478/g.34515  ORF Transcript_18478/g.34515 Transcript_18478/m.34515 type:complete len:293 (-) Transcript_18478:334-1212(-)
MSIEDHEAELTTFKELLVSDSSNVGKDSSDTVAAYMSDRDCMRFLRARNMNVKKASAMAHKWWEWYNTPVQGTSRSASVSPRNILNVLEDPNEDIYIRLMPHSNMGEDKVGRCVYWEQSGEISSRFAEVNKELSVDDLVIRHIRQQEYMIKRLEAASIKHGRDIEKQVIVFNLANLNYSIDLNAMSTFKQTVVIDEAYYPERLQHFFMINAPWFFTAIWAMLKPFIDPVTASKIIIVGSDYMDTLREYIDDSQIPEELGGSFKMVWRWPYHLPDEKPDVVATGGVADSVKDS